MFTVSALVLGIPLPPGSISCLQWLKWLLIWAISFPSCFENEPASAITHTSHTRASCVAARFSPMSLFSPFAVVALLHGLWAWQRDWLWPRDATSEGEHRFDKCLCTADLSFLGVLETLASLSLRVCLGGNSMGLDWARGGRWWAHAADSQLMTSTSHKKRVRPP